MLAEQLDYIAFAVLTAVIYVGVALWMRRARRLTLPAGVIAAAVMVLGAGWFPVQRAGDAEIARVRDMVTGFAPTYAAELTRLGHARIVDTATRDDAGFLTIIDAQKRWLALNPAIVSIYTLRQRADGQMIFVAAAEVDYDHNGVYEGEREQRSFPGDVYKDAGPFWQRGLRGETAFDEQPYTDEWGTWVSAVTPMRAAHGHIEAVLGVDYDAATFLHAVASARGVVIATIGLLLLSMLSLSVIVVLHGAHLHELRAAERFRREKEVAQAADRAKSEFLSNMSHELRTPMHAIISFSRLGREKAGQGNAPAGKLTHYFTRISESSERLLRLLDDLLDLSKLESGKMSYQWSAVDLGALMSEALAEFDAYGRSRGVRVLMSADGLPALRSDRLRLGQVLRNLLSNAIKFSPEGGAVQVVATRARVGRDEGEAVQISIRDEGVGIPSDELESIFDKFVQSSKTRTGAGGTGLGLSIVKAIVTDHGGRIWAANNPEGGATFHLLLPCMSDRPATRCEAADAEPVFEQGG